MDYNFLYTILSAYAIGSIPFAYLFVRFSSGQDVRAVGSGNAGALNSFEVTGSKALGIAVGVLDAVKGAVAVWLAQTYFASGFGTLREAAMWATWFAVLGHCFSPWLGFKGGRGLATTTGATLLFAWKLPVIWCVMWIAAWGYSRRVHFCNISATVLTLCVAPLFEEIEMLTFTIFLVALLLLAHRDVMKEAFKNG